VQNSNGCKYSVVVLEHLQKCSYVALQWYASGDALSGTLVTLIFEPWKDWGLRRLFFFSLIRI
jgi:hypothetical protein